jgi:hypothetical protein
VEGSSLRLQLGCVLKVDEEQYRVWVAELPNLSQTQLNDALMRFKLLSNNGVKAHNGKQEFGDRVLQAICDVLRKQGVETPSVAMLKKSSAYVNSNKGKFDNLSNFFEQISPAKIVQDQILKEGINLLYFDLLQWKVAVSSHTILQQIHRIPSVLNKHFPGYAQSGYLTKIVKVG